MKKPRPKESFLDADLGRVLLMVLGPFVPFLLFLAAGGPYPISHGSGQMPVMFVVLNVAVLVAGPVLGLVMALRLLFSWWVWSGTRALAFSFALMNGMMLYGFYLIARSLH